MQRTNGVNTEQPIGDNKDVLPSGSRLETDKFIDITEFRPAGQHARSPTQ